jgi:hypothetical protein
MKTDIQEVYSLLTHEPSQDDKALLQKAYDVAYSAHLDHKNDQAENPISTTYLKRQKILQVLV